MFSFSFTTGFGGQAERRFEWRLVVTALEPVKRARQLKKKRKEKEKTLRRHSAPFPGIFRRRRRRFPNSVPVTQSKSTSTSKLGPSAPFVGASEEGRGGGVKYSDENEKKNLKAK